MQAQPIDRTRKPLYCCAICGTQKKETNRWFTVGVKQSREGNAGFITIVHFGCTINGDDVYDVCGHECATKLLGQWMSLGID